MRRLGFELAAMVLIVVLAGISVVATLGSARSGDLVFCRRVDGGSVPDSGSRPITQVIATASGMTNARLLAGFGMGGSVGNIETMAARISEPSGASLQAFTIPKEPL